MRYGILSVVCRSLSIYDSRTYDRRFQPMAKLSDAAIFLKNAFIFYSSRRRVLALLQKTEEGGGHFGVAIFILFHRVRNRRGGKRLHNLLGPRRLPLITASYRRCDLDITIPKTSATERRGECPRTALLLVLVLFAQQP